MRKRKGKPSSRVVKRLIAARGNRKSGIPEASMLKCFRAANKAEREHRGSPVAASKHWHHVFDTCVEGNKRSKTLQGTSLLEEFLHAGEIALEKLRLKRKKQQQDG